MKKIDAIEKFLEAKKALDEQVKKVGSDAIKEFLKAFFDEHPSVESIRWTQYTPYFNDGDPCVFSVNTPSVRQSGHPEYQEYWDFEDKKNPLHNSLMALEDRLEELAPVLNAIFGDGVQVTVDRHTEEIEIEYYSHD